MLGARRDPDRVVADRDDVVGHAEARAAGSEELRAGLERVEPEPPHG